MPIMVSLVRITAEKAPWRVRIQWEIRSSQVLPGALASKEAMTSESVLELKLQPHCWCSSVFSWPALMTLPLCPAPASHGRPLPGRAER